MQGDSQLVRSSRDEVPCLGTSRTSNFPATCCRCQLCLDYGIWEISFSYADDVTLFVADLSQFRPVYAPKDFLEVNFIDPSTKPIHLLVLCE